MAFLHARTVVALSFAFSGAAFAAEPGKKLTLSPAPKPSNSTATVTARRELPEIVYSDNAPAEMMAAGEGVSARLEGVLAYWRKAGFTEVVPLDTISAIASYDGMTVTQLLGLLNPEIDDIQAHVRAQYEHFRASSFYERLRELEKRNDVPSGTFRTVFFDTYSRLRYGYGFPNFYEEVMADPFVNDVYADASESRPADNAYYGRFPQIDLTKLLPLEDPKGDIELAFLSLITTTPDTMSFWELLARSRVGMARRIVALPRLLQSPELWRWSFLFDTTGMPHEFGHSMVAALGEAPRMVDEATADWIAASAIGTPIIGGPFAQVSGEIVELAKKDPALAKRMARTLEHLAELARRGSLRDMTEVWTIDHLTRSTRFADAYESGHPIRTMLWRMRERLGEAKRNAWERVTIQTIREMAKKPLLVPQNTLVLLNMRRVTLELERRKAIATETARRKTNPRPQDKTVSIEEAVSQQLEAREKSEQSRRLAQHQAGQVAVRPAIQSDYILFEYFREQAWAAQVLGSHDLLESIREEAGRVLNATGVYVTSASGRKNLVFFRDAKEATNPTTLTHLGELFTSREAAESAIAALAHAINPRESAVNALATQLSFAMGAVQEFERFGDAKYLHNPWPKFDESMRRWKEMQKTCGDALTAGEDDE